MFNCLQLATTATSRQQAAAAAARRLRAQSPSTAAGGRARGIDVTHRPAQTLPTKIFSENSDRPNKDSQLTTASATPENHSPVS
ncbi:unnamed protein product [Plutella xylostella]|uniref:(diamondback moth) hypothetical protein n=1 Tax=Plutella xylostella TaxID=51655 RepID=A0A8S4EBK8_PLUXY|nr:unnamed protein product [Plutella xylostella]